MAWRLDASLVKLREQINHLYWMREKIHDGSIGDAAHSSRVSDHNPDEKGIVRAIDIDDDPKNGFSAGELAERLRIHKDPRIKIVIWNNKLFSSYPSGGINPWIWRPYTGPNAHKHHVHISIVSEITDDSRNWLIV